MALTGIVFPVALELDEDVDAPDAEPAVELAAVELAADELGADEAADEELPPLAVLVPPLDPHAASRPAAAIPAATPAALLPRMAPPLSPSPPVPLGTDDT